MLTFSAWLTGPDSGFSDSKLVSLLSEKKINRETNDVANNALSVQKRGFHKFHKERTSVKEGGAAQDVVAWHCYC